ncbi:MAG: class I SAM-dependent methyltransferase [Patescibacteria group bacterium]
MLEREPIPEEELAKAEQQSREGWDRKYQEGYHAEMKNVASLIRRFFEEHHDEIKPGDKVLEIGCGNGRNLTYMAEQGLNTFGIDISATALKEAKQILKDKNLDAHLSEASFYKLPFADQSFKAIISNASLHSIPWEGAKKAFSEINRVLQDNGLFFMRVPATRIKSENKDLLFHYTRDQLEQLAEENSLIIKLATESPRSDQRFENDTKIMWQATFQKESRAE